VHGRHPSQVEKMAAFLFATKPRWGVIIGLPDIGGVCVAVCLAAISWWPPQEKCAWPTSKSSEKNGCLFIRAR
jgi:hypothetical protein